MINKPQISEIIKKEWAMKQKTALLKGAPHLQQYSWKRTKKYNRDYQNSGRFLLRTDKTN